MRSFQVRDLRNKAFFMVDDLYLNGYAKHLGPSASMVYISLCRHADKDQTAFPSQRLIAEEIGINERIVMGKVKVLEDWGIIRKEKVKNSDGKWLNNTYFLLDKSLWKKPPTQNMYVETTYIKNTKPPTQNMHIKETHIKETHITPYSPSLKEEDLIEIANAYNIPLSMVKLSYEKMNNWIEAKGKRYKNYKAALRNWVLKDAQEVIQAGWKNNKKGGIDARSVQ